MRFWVKLKNKLADFCPPILTSLSPHLTFRIIVLSDVIWYYVYKETEKESKKERKQERKKTREKLFELGRQIDRWMYGYTYIHTYIDTDRKAQKVPSWILHKRLRVIPNIQKVASKQASKQARKNNELTNLHIWKTMMKRATSNTARVTAKLAR